MACGSDSRDLQQARALRRAGANDDLSLRPKLFLALAPRAHDSHGAPSLEQDSVETCLVNDADIGLSSYRRWQERMRGADASSSRIDVLGNGTNSQLPW